MVRGEYLVAVSSPGSQSRPVLRLFAFSGGREDSLTSCITIRRFVEDDALKVRRLFIAVNQLLSPPDLRDAFETYIQRALVEEMDRISAYYEDRKGSFWVATRGSDLVGAFGLEPVSDDSMELRRMYVYARQGINLDRSTLADWVGRAAFLLRPVHDRLLAVLKSSAKLFADETTAPVLDPGRGRTKTGQLWAYARDDRPLGRHRSAGCRLCLRARSQGRAADRAPGRLQGHPAGRRLWRLSHARRARPRRACLLLGACPPALL